MANQWPRTAIASAVPVIFLAVAVLQWSRRNPSRLSESGAKVAEKVTAKPKELLKKHKPAEAGLKVADKVTAKLKSVPKKHKPKSYARYFVISLLIRAIEHERSRKAVVGALRIALKRA